MVFLEPDAWVSVGGDAYVDRLVCHPVLPLVAGRESGRPAVHVWECGAGRLRELAIVGADAAAYQGAHWNRIDQIPTVAWHPQEPRLLLTGEAGLRQWTSNGLSLVDGVPSDATYRYVAFSPDGLTVWASPSSDDGEPDWDSSDAFDVAAGTRRRARPWDAGVALHPSGELVATLSSDQGATLGFFARPEDAVPARMRLFRRALVLDADGYQTPVFSPDGRFMAIRGNAYGNSLDVFEFPSLRRVLGTTLGEPNPGVFPYPPEWLEQMRSWSADNIAFAKTSGALLVGTPRGTIVEVDLDDHRAVEHDALGGSPVSALAVLKTGDLVIASRTGELAVLPEPGGRAGDATTSDRARDLATAFIVETSELPDDADLETDLVLTDGKTTWEPEDLATVTTAAGTDPTWLQLRALMNAPRDKA